MQPVIEYFLGAALGTPLLSEIPLHILELIDGKDAVTADPESLSQQKDPEPDHERTVERSFDHECREPRFSNGNHDTDDQTSVNTSASAQSNTSYTITIAIVAVLLFFMLWRVVTFPWIMQLSGQETLLYQCFYWVATLGTAGRLMYALGACARFYVYVFRPCWLPEGIPLRVQTFKACGVALTLVIQAFYIVVACVMVKILVYDNLVKLVVVILGIGGS
ncbi:hypothetical protein PV04_02698 [Phialophora macrospora]|uniref:Uncharacterized protein n=1 Tax=Phialophora macrospora TaxID=1851006 RepID=A0A0D2FQ59_9EURO|nr:hypothetical protein PV04_02698 [Phialophora macrospora]